MDSKQLVSVIVPVYNVEAYIRRTVASIQEQDYDNIEIILVDDGSSDRCPDIIDDFAAADDRVKAIHQENAGVSSARNAGLSAAMGNYILFVDGDDWVETNYVSYYVGLLERTGCAVGMSTRIFEKTASSSSHERVVTAERAIEWIYTEDINVAVWNKVYRADVIKRNGLRFDPAIWYGEGMLFNIEVLQNVDKVALGSLPVYHQVFNPGSAMRSFNLESNICGLKSLDIQRGKWQKITPEIDAAWTFHKYRFNRSIIAGLVRTKSVKSHRKTYDECVRNLRDQAHIPMRFSEGTIERLKWMLWIAAPRLAGYLASKKFYQKAGNQKPRLASR